MARGEGGGLRYDELSLEQRCDGIVIRTGERCKRPKMTGIDFCSRHGGQLPNLRAKSKMAKTLIGLEKLVTPIPIDDWEANPVNSFTMEFRRTIAAIRYYDEKLAALHEQDLFWGLTQQEIDTTGEFPGTRTTSEAKINLAEESRRWERRHLLDLQKLWINAGMQQQALQIERDKMEMFERVMNNIIVGLGRDPTDPDVRGVVRASLLEIPGAA